MSTDKIIIIGGGIITVVLIIGISLLLTNGNSSSSSIPDEQIVARNGLHWHPKLSIMINGQKQELTDGIGLGSVHQEMHTHDEDYKDGVVHMEMQGIVTKDETRLGRFFEIWGKKFSPTQIFDEKNDTEKTVKMLVNGKENKEFEKYLMQDSDKIEIRYD